VRSNNREGEALWQSPEECDTRWHSDHVSAA
jgi:hypothetical protein